VICHVGIPKVINPECYIRDRKEINFTNRLYDLATNALSGMSP
jgi:hypothetical protein